MFDEIIKNIKKYKIFILVVFLYLLAFQLIDPHGSNCLIKRTIGIPCPSCGMTRATYYLFTFQFDKAFYYHPLVFIMPITLGTFLLNGYGIFKTLFRSKLFWGFIIVSFVVVYVLRMYLYFPHTEPMDYYSYIIRKGV